MRLTPGKARDPRASLSVPADLSAGKRRASASSCQCKNERDTRGERGRRDRISDLGAGEGLARENAVDRDAVRVGRLSNADWERRGSESVGKVAMGVGEVAVAAAAAMDGGEEEGRHTQQAVALPRNEEEEEWMHILY